MCGSSVVPPTQPINGQQTTSKRAQAPAKVAPDAKYYVGSLKSYNERRGFGFVACDETARCWGRDVYLSKVESQGSVGDVDEPLKEGSHVQFAVVLSEEGFPQAAAVKRLQQLCGTVSQFSEAQGGTIVCDAATPDVPGDEVLVPLGSFGRLILHPGDRVSFCLVKPLASTGPKEAQLIQLIGTSRPQCAMLGCFSVELPRSVVPEVISVVPIVLDCHAFQNQLCLAGVPGEIGETELMQFFGKHGATHVAILPDGFASVHFSSMFDVARLLARELHAFNDQNGGTLVARFDASRSGKVDSLPSMAPPALWSADAGSIVASWSPLGIAVAYELQLRIAGAGGWSSIDSNGRVQPAGASPLLNPQTTSLTIGGLNAGSVYEIRVIYVVSCGCRAKASAPSAPCMSGPASPSVPCLSQPLPQAVPVASPSTPSQMLSSSSYVPALMQPTSSPVCCPHGMIAPRAPLSPEVTIADCAGTAISVQWQSVNCGETSYVVEICDSNTLQCQRCTCPAPAHAVDRMQICVGGLVPGCSYTALVRSVMQCGCESAPSGWSQWRAVSAALAPPPPPPVSFAPSVVHSRVSPPAFMPSPQQSTNLQAHLGCKQMDGLVLAPEVTGCEEALFLD